MKKKIFAITLCALIAAASIVGSTEVVDNSNVAASVLGPRAGGYLSLFYNLIYTSQLLFLLNLLFLPQTKL